MSTRATWQKLQILKIQDGGRPPFWKLLNRHISVKNRPILMKLGTLHQILNPMTVTWPKIEMATAAILKNFFWQQLIDRLSDFGEILCEEVERHADKVHMTKTANFSIQDGGRPPFWKSLNHHISVKLLLDFDKIWCTAAYIETDDVIKALSQYLRCDKDKRLKNSKY